MRAGRKPECLPSSARKHRERVAEDFPQRRFTP